MHWQLHSASQFWFIPTRNLDEQEDSLPAKARFHDIQDDPALKIANYNLHQAITSVTREFQNKLEAQFNQADAKQLWQGHNTFMGYYTKSSAISGNNTSLPDELNASI